MQPSRRVIEDVVNGMCRRARAHQRFADGYFFDRGVVGGRVVGGLVHVLDGRFADGSLRSGCGGRIVDGLGFDRRFADRGVGMFGVHEGESEFPAAAVRRAG